MAVTLRGSWIALISTLKSSILSKSISSASNRLRFQLVLINCGLPNLSASFTGRKTGGTKTVPNCSEEDEKEEATRSCKQWLLLSLHIDRWKYRWMDGCLKPAVSPCFCFFCSCKCKGIGSPCRAVTAHRQPIQPCSRH